MALIKRTSDTASMSHLISRRVLVNERMQYENVIICIPKKIAPRKIPMKWAAEMEKIGIWALSKCAAKTVYSLNIYADYKRSFGMMIWWRPCGRALYKTSQQRHFSWPDCTQIYLMTNVYEIRHIHSLVLEAVIGEHSTPRAKVPDARYWRSHAWYFWQLWFEHEWCKNARVLILRM